MIASVYYCVLPVVVLVALGRHDDPKWLLRFVVSWCACCLVKINQLHMKLEHMSAPHVLATAPHARTQLDSPAARVLHRITPGMAA